MVPTDTAGVVATLHELIATCRDGASGFRTAAEHVRNPILNAQFNSYAQQRDLFAGELEAEVQARGETPEGTGSLAGSIPRGWVSLRSAVTRLDDAIILAMCIRGEDAALARYECALAMGLPSDIRIILERQRWAILESRHHLTGLRKTHLDEGLPGAAPTWQPERPTRRRAPMDRKRAPASAKTKTAGPKKRS